VANPKEDKYVMVRLTKRDHQRLTDYQRRFSEWVKIHPGGLPPWTEDQPLSLSAVIRLLLYRQDMKEARAVTSNNSRR